jgi:hypothetical protein
MRQLLPVVPAKQNPHYQIFISFWLWHIQLLKSYNVKAHDYNAYNYDNRCYLTWDEVQYFLLNNINSDIWNRHGHECSRIWKWSANFTVIHCIKIMSTFFGPRYIGDDLYRAESCPRVPDYSASLRSRRDPAAAILYAFL